MKETGYLDATLSNGARPDAILAPTEPISPFEAERLAKDFIQRFKGQGNGGILVADGPMTVTPIGWPPRDLAELQLYQTIKTNVCNTFHVPPDIWEMGESNRATAEAALYALAVHCLKPRLCRLVEKLNERLIPYYDDRLFFEADDVVPEDKTFELSKMQFLAQTGSITRNEIRIREGLEPTDWGNEPLLPPGMLPMQQEEEQAEVNLQPAPEPIDRSGQAPGLAQLQQAVYSGQLPREAAIANVQLTFGFTPEQAQALFPAVAPVKLTPDEEAEQPQADPQQPAPTKAKALNVPDVRQQGDYDCGAAATMAVCQFFGVGPDDEAAYIQALGTTEEDGTQPEAICQYLQSVGLTAQARNDLEIKDLAKFAEQGQPVICCIQDYEDSPEDIPEEASGHYVVVTAADDDTVSLQDPSAGPVQMPTLEFLSRWEDTGPQDYVHFGIAVTRPQGKGYRTKAIKRKSPIPMAEALQKFFRKQRDTVLTKVKSLDAAQTKALPLNGWFDLEEWTQEMAAIMRPVVALYYDYSARATVSRIGASFDLLKVVQPDLQKGMDRATMLFCRETNETTSRELGEAVKSLRQSLTEGLEAGELQKQLTARVEEIFDSAEQARAYRIAVTEASRSQHAAQELTAQGSGLVQGKRWMLSDDACPLCLPLANKVVPLGESFTTDETMGSYSNITYPPRHPHCRCDMVEVIEGVND